MRQSIFLLTLVLLFVFASCKKESETPTSPPNIDKSWTAVPVGTTVINALAVSGSNVSILISQEANDLTPLK